tara:strand:- start:93 stop:338 length:246 start_codon:yes stop_codon:yes gene_type:complete
LCSDVKVRLEHSSTKVEIQEEPASEASIETELEAEYIILFIIIAVENSDRKNNNKHTKPCFLAEILILFKTNGDMNNVLYY